ncbi:AAA family ATPase [Reinekea sp.]|jgi:predicted kinase|uniref:AAA family ATPase n=1 Tax=Reinekea sp. TaxID=1970455 RepID=UPI003989D6E7
MNELGTLHFFIGKMGAGKTTYSTKLSKEIGGVLISEDEWLNKLYPNEINNFDDFLVRHSKLLDVIGPHVQKILKAGSSVVLDFPANTIKDRKRYLNIANEIKAPHVATYLNVSNELCLLQIAKRRLEQPDRVKFDTPEVFEMVTQYFEEPNESEGLSLHIME